MEVGNPAVAEKAFWDRGGIYRRPDHPVVEMFARQRVAHLLQLGLLADVASLLDVGAGSGFSSRYYPRDIQVVAVDSSIGMLRQNSVPARAVTTCECLPFPDAAFDVVACWELLHHLDHPDRGLAEMLRVARRRVILFEPNRVNPGHVVLGVLRKNERRSLRYSPRYLRRIVRKAMGPHPSLHQRVGLLFPNITPLALARAIVRLPFRMPLVGISQLLVLEVTDDQETVSGNRPEASAHRRGPL
jgi:SAM-dependent methyltransferase